VKFPTRRRSWTHSSFPIRGGGLLSSYWSHFNFSEIFLEFKPFLTLISKILKSRNHTALAFLRFQTIQEWFEINWCSMSWRPLRLEGRRCAQTKNTFSVHLAHIQKCIYRYVLLFLWFVFNARCRGCAVCLKGQRCAPMHKTFSVRVAYSHKCIYRHVLVFRDVFFSTHDFVAALCVFRLKNAHKCKRRLACTFANRVAQ